MTTTPATTSAPTIRQRRQKGVVVSDVQHKTIVVAVERTLRHKLYGKSFKRTRRFQVHDEKNQFKKGDVVEFVECRPLSKTKRWRVIYSA